VLPTEERYPFEGRENNRILIKRRNYVAIKEGENRDI
jgi:hypothetical protein